MRFSHRKLTAGFTLIEIIMGIVAFSIALSIVSSLIGPTEQHSADQIHQVKAAELGQAMLDEILGRAFDENSDMAGGRERCGENGTSCTAQVNFGSEEGNNRELFDDVDDYNGYNAQENSTGDGLDSGYGSFTINVAVTYDGLTLGLASDNLAKKITVTITTPLGTDIEFAAYKANF
ncbi:prepilin-type N-terminal cleavage/methylation domain-containing protein [Colwelliaceae bacterium 6471]